MNFMMVIRAGVMGFCMGVRRVVRLVEETAANNSGRVIMTLGPVIHNPQIMERFARLGVRVAGSAREVEPGALVIVRAHGVPPADWDQLKERGAEIVDGTCPNVIASQKIVGKYSNMGYSILIAGDRNHGELRGLAGFGSDVHIIDNPEDARTVQLGGKILLLAQTTIKKGEFELICRILGERQKDILIRDTICPATEERQTSLANLKAHCSAILVIGGRDSANTRRLTMTAAEGGFPAWQIETAGEIPDAVYGYPSVGLTAGASTPDFIIDQVEERLLNR
jgi:4-hydroxy-3-methylbut-2-enyl diphosphate reductase